VKEISAHERLGDLFRRKFTYLGKKKGGNGKCDDVKFRYFELMTKKKSSEILADEDFFGKSYVTCEIFLDRLTV